MSDQYQYEQDYGDETWARMLAWCIYRAARQYGLNQGDDPMYDEHPKCALLRGLANYAYGQALIRDYRAVRGMDVW